MTALSLRLIWVWGVNEADQATVALEAEIRDVFRENCGMQVRYISSLNNAELSADIAAYAGKFSGIKLLIQNRGYPEVPTFVQPLLDLLSKTGSSVSLAHRRGIGRIVIAVGSK